MPKIASREIRLASRPQGLPTAANFTLAQIELAPLQEGQVLARNLYMSVDPYMRGRMNSGKSYVPPFELGKPLEGGAVGEVIASRAKEFKPGDAVTSRYGWREYFIASPKELHPVSRKIQPLSVYLGALGMTGMTAWAGLQLVEVRSGETIFISGAAGAVGSVAGQLAKLRGCRVIGSAGSMEKVMFLREECGFDIALIACGGISGYNEEKPRPGPSNLFNITTKRLTMKGLMVLDWLDRQAEFEKEVGGYFKAGNVKHKETVVKGIDKAVGAFLGLFQGQNVGKMVVELA
jgi:NADPH-dependent curcumin reductase CurA